MTFDCNSYSVCACKEERIYCKYFRLDRFLFSSSRPRLYFHVPVEVWKFYFGVSIKGLSIGFVARLNLQFPLESLFWFVAMPENGECLVTELLTTFVIGNFGHRHEFRDALQTARHRASRLRVGHFSRCGLIFQRCSYFVFCFGWFDFSSHVH